MSEQVRNALNPASVIEKMSLEDFSKLQELATRTYALHFHDPLQAATDDVLGQCLDALRGISDNCGDGGTYDAIKYTENINKARRIVAMTGGEK